MPVQVVTTVALEGTVASVTVHTNSVDTKGPGLSAATSVTDAASHSTTTVVPEASLEFLVNLCTQLSASDQRQHLKQLRDALIQLKLDHLRQQLAEVELEIKTLLSLIAAKRKQETEIKDDLQAEMDRDQPVLRNLQRAAESFAETLRATNILS